MAIGRITGQMLSSTLSRDTVDLTLATTGESNLLHVDATNDRIGIGLNNPTVQFQTTGSAIVGTDLTVTGNLTVNGSTTTINTTNLTVDDKNIELAHSLSGQAPTDAAADGGGIILKGDTDHTILWSNAQNSWDFSENVSVATGSAYQINNVNVLDANNLTLENIQITGNTITSASNADISLQPSGTGVVKLNGISIDGDVITSDDSTAVTIGENLNIDGTLSFNDGQGVSTISNDSTLAGNSSTALVTESAVKSYVDANAGGQLGLGDSASNSGSVDLTGDVDLEFRSGNSVTLTVSGNGVTAALNKSIDVNEISSTDSTAVIVNDGLNVNGNLDVGSSFTISNGTAVTAILDEDTLSSDSDTALATQQSIKAYVDTEIAGLSQTIKFSDDTSSVVTIDMKNDTVSMAGGNSITSTITDDTITFALDKSIDVNEISSGDSTAIQINDGVNITGALNVASSLEIGNGPVVTAILDEDNLVSDSDTAIPTQQSVKAYVDSQTSASNLTVIDDASSSVSINLEEDDFKIGGGNSITTSISGDSVSVALDSDITVNSINSADSSFVRINDSLETEAAQINQTLTVDGDAQIKGNLTVQGTTTYIETTNTKVSDPLLLLNNGNSGGADIDSGIMVERGSAGNNAVFYWNEGDDRFKAVLTTSGEDASTIADDSYATMNLGGLVFGSESVVVTSILDEDAMGSDSDTALATQQSIKAYVDNSISALSTTIKFADDGSTVLTADLQNDTISLAGGDSITSAISGDTVTFNLNDDITVNQIGAKDSSAVSITSPLQATTVQASGNVTVANDITLASGSITSASGTIDFGDENLTTTGNITATGATVTASALDVQTISSTDSTTILVNDGIRVEGASNFQSDVEVYGTLYTNFIAPEDSASISVQGNLGVDGNFDVGSNFTISNGSAVIDRILDQDDLGSDSATALVTQQSVKAYVDDQVAGVQINAIGDIGNVDAQDGDLTDGDVLVVNDDSSNVFTISSQMTTALRVPSGTTAQRPSSYTGAIRFNTDTNQYEGCTDGSSFTAFAMAGNAESLAKDVFAGDGGATYNFSNVSNPVEGGNSNGALGLIVYIDNVLQEPTQNYTITNTAITFDSVVHSGARIVVIQGFDGGAGGGAGGGLTQVENTDVDSAVENLDTFPTTTYRAVKYVYRIENAGAGEYQAGEILVVHDGTTAYLTEYAKIATGNNDLITFTTDISGGFVRLRGSAQAPNSNFLAKKIVLSVV